MRLVTSKCLALFLKGNGHYYTRALCLEYILGVGVFAACVRGYVCCNYVCLLDLHYLLVNACLSLPCLLTIIIIIDNYSELVQLQKVREKGAASGMYALGIDTYSEIMRRMIIS